MIETGASAVVFGKHPVTVEKVCTSGKRVFVTGPNYTGWTKAGNVKVTS